MHKKAPKGNNYKVKQELSFLYVTYRHDLIYITVKCHQNISNSIQVIAGTQKC